MKWESLLETVAGKPIFSTAQLVSENEPARQATDLAFESIKYSRDFPV